MFYYNYLKISHYRWFIALFTSKIRKYDWIVDDFEEVLITADGNFVVKW